MTASRLLFHILIAILFHAAFRPRQCTVKFQLQNLYDTRIKRQKFVRVCTIRIWKFREIFFRETCGCFLKSDFVRERRTTYGKYIRKKELRKPLEKELKEYRSQGISLYLDGKPSTPKNIAKACQIAEDGGYMRDYVEDEKGRIARVDFDFIREK